MNGPSFVGTTLIVIGGAAWFRALAGYSRHRSEGRMIRGCLVGIAFITLGILILTSQ